MTDPDHDPDRERVLLWLVDVSDPHAPRLCAQTDERRLLRAAYADFGSSGKWGGDSEGRPKHSHLEAWLVRVSPEGIALCLAQTGDLRTLTELHDAFGPCPGPRWLETPVLIDARCPSERPSERQSWSRRHGGTGLPVEPADKI